ncbi:MAG: hypothetical protein LBD07_01710 [Spirochaetaceae bacterium]|nr:hypothetical protein [Spirochaetaceae bacterium]
MEYIDNKDKAAYKSLITCLKKHRKGLTAADITIKTALPLENVRELLPAAADEYSARLRVTESGEILYSFPNGFKSKYRGIRAVLARFFETAAVITKTAAVNLFKLWILVMLVGYFMLFVLIAFASVIFAIAVQSSSKRDKDDSRGGFIIVTHILDLIIRIWFYSELVKSFDSRHDGWRNTIKPKTRPLYKAVFSFVFGEGDINAGTITRERQAVLAYIRESGGIISLPEFMILTGKSPAEAEESITAFCTAYNGSPEATEDGTVVYRFEELLFNTGKNQSSALYSGPVYKLNIFSSNEKKFNRWFSVLNMVNLLFGAYFTLNTLYINIMANIDSEQAYVYSLVYKFTEKVIGTTAYPVMLWWLGLVPLTFSILFWLIPFIRNKILKKNNERIKFINFRQFACNTIWKNPVNITAGALNPTDPSSRPLHFKKAQDAVITELSAYYPVKIEANDSGEFRYSFEDLEWEKTSLKKHRALVKTRTLGNVIFDSGETESNHS